MRRSIYRRRFLFLVSLLIFHVSSGQEESTVAPMLRKEQEALYLVIQDFVGKWWNGSELYPDPCGWTQIQGVSCDLFDDLWYVTGISIGPVLDNSLECAEDAVFNPLLFEFKHLKCLSFFDCFSSSHKKTIIPASHWEKLAKTLETLEFRSNPALAGEVPANLMQLAQLQSLVLLDNSLSGELPQELGDLVHLRRLQLAGNHFSGRIPASLGNNMSELLILDLSRNSLTGPLPPSLGEFASLLKLDLSDNLLQGSIPPELGELRSLALLDLRNNKLSGGIPQALQNVASLQDLLLSSNPLGGNLLEFDWAKLTNLATLDLSRTNLSGAIPESIVNMKRLRFLALDNNDLSGSVSPSLAALPSLMALYLDGNNLTGELKFSDEFYRRMGRRFSSRGNPHLCYSSMGSAAGVEQCKREQVSANFDQGFRNEANDGNLDEKSSNMSVSIASPASSISAWLLLLVLL